MRKYLSPAFSQRSLTEQEFLISKSVDKFIAKLGKIGAKGTDIVLEFALMSFDIIGDLGFGETFQGIESDHVHPWIHRMTGAMMQGALADTFFRFPLMARFVLYFFSGPIKRIIADTKINEQYSIDLVKKRLQKQATRKDFFTRILENNDDDDAISHTQLAAHASDIVLAGSETSSTCLSTITYHLLRNPSILQELQAEVRNTFASYEEIDAASTASLKYLQVVILEGLRIYPPLPFALPRVVPKGGDTVDGHFLPAGVRTHCRSKISFD
ncbi:MAG: hypothetical protein Q9160_001599 [Pyrenula sp. 1 TL-2023]